MPHLTLEYTPNLPAFDARALLMECNQVLADSGQFAEVDIKSRTAVVEPFVVGIATEPRGFIHATLALLSGRSPEIKRDLSQRLSTVLQRHFPPIPGLHLQIVVELQDMDRDSFTKVYVTA